jgi:hypothetical protein
MKIFRLFLFMSCLVVLGRADIPINVLTTGFGALVLDTPLTRTELEKLTSPTLNADKPTPTLWLRWADGTECAIDQDVTRLLPDHLLKVYTMSSLSPLLTPGEHSGPATLLLLDKPAFGPDDWALKPGEVAEKARLVTAFNQRYGSKTKGDELAYYTQAEVLTDPVKAPVEKQKARKAGRDKPAPSLKSAFSRLSKKGAIPIVCINGKASPRTAYLPINIADLTSLSKALQVPLGNYNYDPVVIEALDKPNELTVDEAQGIDLFALAQRELGDKRVAAVELICYNGFTSTLTAPDQGLLLIPPDGDIAAGLAAGSLIFACYEEPVIIALRKAGQSPAEAASGVISIQVLLR